VTIKELASALNSTVSEIEEVLKNLGEAPKSSEDVIEFEIAELVCLEADTIAVCKVIYAVCCSTRLIQHK
jgi:hypothetical protein